MSTTEQRLLEWVRGHLAKTLGVAPESIEFDKRLSNYGLDSVDAILMAGELEEAFGIEIDPASFIECDSFESAIALLASYVDKSGKNAASP
jgi:acyl carrier protein